MVDKVARITPKGVVTEFPLPRPCPPPRCSPHEITAGPDDAMWFTEVLGNRIGRVSFSGEITDFDLPHARSAPNVITRGPAGTLVFTESGLTGDDPSRIGAITTDGRFFEWDLPLGTSPFGIITGHGGHIWFAETGTLANPGERIGLIVGAHGQITAALRRCQSDRPRTDVHRRGTETRSLGTRHDSRRRRGSHAR
jgi:virginiamycin B lyase